MKSEKRTEKIEFKVTKSEKKRIKEKANRISFDVSEYVRYCTLNAQISINVGGESNSNYADIIKADRLFKDKKIGKEERDRIVLGSIDNILKTS